MNVSQKHLHDYYHNTFCVQFYDNLEAYEQEIEEMAMQLYLKNSNRIHLSVMEQLMLKHPSAKFHY